MKHLRFSFDVVSPYAYLAFERLPEVLEGLDVEVSYEPVLLAGLLSHWNQKGPAEVPPKRDWMYRQVGWLARKLDVPFQMPAAHPFNPLPLLRLAWAGSPVGLTPNRWICEQLLHHVWRGGADAGDLGRLQNLTHQLSPLRDAAGADVKAQLKQVTAEAALRGVFGVPTVEADGRLFWGLDGLELLVAWLRGDAWFDGPAWDGAVGIPVGAQRKH